jgi:hypothetical protein
MARPRLAKSQLHDTPVTVRLNDELEAFFEGEARRRDVPLAIVLREYLVNQVRLVKAERLGKFQNELKAKPPP